MLGRNSYALAELEAAKSEVARQLAAFDSLPGDDPVFEATFFNSMVVALDRRFVHRVRTVTGKNTNPLSELEAITESLLDHKGMFTPGSVVKWVPEQSITGLAPGDRIALTRDQFDRLSTATFAVLESKFLT